MKAVIPFPMRRTFARLRAIRGLADLIGRWGSAGLHASISRSATARLWRQVRVGKRVVVDPGTHFHTNDNGHGHRIVIDDDSFVGRYSFFSAGESIYIGRYCNIGAACQLLSAGHAYHDPTQPYVLAPVLSYGRMHLGPNTWVGVGCTLVGGIQIGFGCILAAGSLLKNSLPPLCMAAGHPARIIKCFDLSRGEWYRLPLEEPARTEALNLHIASLPDEAIYMQRLKVVRPHLEDI
jgi:acetyltransferase-like isoleucine patch superfamily enzyme